jgi:DNA primase
VDFKEQVKAAADIAHVIGEVVKLQPAGPNRFKGLCPFHNEKTPSFNVDRAKQFYYCFGCHKGGDVFQFVQEMEGGGFFDALKSLAERYGIPMPRRADYSDEASRERDALMAMQEVALRHYRASMNREVADYLRGRSVRQDTIEEFGLGYAPQGSTLVAKLKSGGFSNEQIAASGLAVLRDDGTMYDRFRHRMMIPIHNESGKVIAFGGRALGDDEPKYLNSSETKIYSKKRVLYNLHRAKETIRRLDYTILVEGYMDVIGLSQAGVKNTVASCGTALSDEHVRTVRRHSDRIVVNFDPDDAGANAAERSIQMLLEQSMRIRILTLDDGLDPDEFVAAHGVERYRERAAAAESYFHWLADRTRSRYDMRSVEGRMDGFRDLLAPAIERVADRLERLAIVNDVAAYLGVDSKAILDQMRRSDPARTARREPQKPPTISPVETLLIRGLFEHPGLAAALEPRLRSQVSSPVLLTILDVAKLGSLTYDQVNARLDEASQALLAQTLLADKHLEAVSQEQLLACADNLDGAARQKAQSGIRQRVKELERQGRFSEAMELLRSVEQGRGGA